ncbi:MAG: exosortase/archaeosortase family protein, partial [Desulfobacula sp.]
MKGLNPAAQAVILALAFVGAYYVPFSSLYHTWMTNDDYSYGLLIPLISFYFLWEKKNILKNTPVKPFWPALPVLVLFVLLSIYGVLGSSGHISRPALPVLVILFVVFCFGIEIFKTLSLALCFLVFMIPLPTVLDRTVGVFLKSVSSHMGGLLLQTLGYSVHVSGNVIDLGVTQLQVVDACSGLRFLFPLIALGVVYGYFFEKVMWKRVACVLITPPIAILTNILRIGITGILTYSFGSKMAEGFFHDFQGWADRK